MSITTTGPHAADLPLGAGVRPHDGRSVVTTTREAARFGADGRPVFRMPLRRAEAIGGDPIRLPESEPDGGEAPELLADVPGPVDFMSWYRPRINREPLLSAQEEIELARWIEAGLFAEDLLRRGATAAGATDEELRRLAERGRAARDRTIVANLRLALEAASRAARNGMPLEDVVQAANAGLIRAVEGFDHRMGNRFSTYAVHWIDQTVRRAVSTDSRTIRVPDYRHHDLVRLFVARSMLWQETGREPVAADLAAALGCSVPEVEVLQLIEPAPYSLDVEVPTLQDGGDVVRWEPLGAGIADPHAPATEEAVLAETLPQQLRSALATLDAREQEVLRVRFGLHGDQPRTLREAAEQLGITPVEVRRIEVRAITALRRGAADPLQDYLAA